MFSAVHIPDFMVQAVMRGEPGLRSDAVALVDGNPPVLNVVAANERALHAGIELCMAKSQAEQFPGIQIRQRSHTQEKAAHAALLDAGWSISPRVEDSAPDAIVLDLAGLGSLFGSEENIVKKLGERAASMNLIAHIAVASNPEAALLAARGFTGTTLIPPGEEVKRLSCLPVSALLPSAEICETFERWGVRTCGALAALPALELSERLGQEAIRLHELARGARVRSLVLARPEQCFEEELELDYAVAELEPLAFLLGRLLDQICARLAARSLAACVIRLRFDLESGHKNTLPPKNEKYGNENGKFDTKVSLCVYEQLFSLPVPMRDSKMLLKLVRLRLESAPPSAPILKILIGAEPTRPRSVQSGLFLPASPDPAKLELVIARLANLVGNSNVGSPQLMNTHRPDEFRMDRFLPPRDRERHRKRDTASRAATAMVERESRMRRSLTAFRIFRPPLPARVEVRDGRPARVSFRGLRGAVVAASGPWRTSGDWWRDDAWQHDEWDLELRFAHSRQKQIAGQPQHGRYCIYYDSLRHAWFVRGTYD